jgi:hypothetical protein
MRYEYDYSGRRVLHAATARKLRLDVACSLVATLVVPLVTYLAIKAMEVGSSMGGF